MYFLNKILTLTLYAADLKRMVLTSQLSNNWLIMGNTICSYLNTQQGGYVRITSLIIIIIIIITMFRHPYMYSPNRSPKP